MRPGFSSSRLLKALAGLLLSYSALAGTSHQQVRAQGSPAPSAPKEGGRYREIGWRMLGDMKNGLKEHYA